MRGMQINLKLRKHAEILKKCGMVVNCVDKRIFPLQMHDFVEVVASSSAHGAEK